MRANLTIFIVCLLVVTSQAQQPSQQPSPAPRLLETVPSCPELATALTTVIRNDARMRDWPNLARYREQNRELLDRGASGSRVVVFMGDSITDFWTQPRFGDFFAAKPYIGRGISGQTTPQMLIRFRPDVIDLHPKAVVILAGTNDIAGNTGPLSDEDIEGNIATMAELARGHGIRVILASITPVSAYHTSPTGMPQTTVRPMSRIHAVNEWMKKYAADQHHIYLDYFSAMVDARGQLREELSADDLHPNAKGYAVMGPLAEAAIKEALR